MGIAVKHRKIFISVTQRVQNFDTGNVVSEQIEGETEV